VVPGYFIFNVIKHPSNNGSDIQSPSVTQQGNGVTPGLLQELGKIACTSITNQSLLLPLFSPSSFLSLVFPSICKEI
jgi:hypothetical protein